MPRRARGPYLCWRGPKPGRSGVWTIRWSESGRSFERSTGSEDRGEAEAALAELIGSRRRIAGPRDPSQFPIAAALDVYAKEHGPEIARPDRIAHAMMHLVSFFASCMVSDVTGETCAAYIRARSRSAGTVRRELGVLRAAINHCVRRGVLTRPVHVFLPPKPDGRDKWLTREEVAALVRAARRDPRARLHLPLFILMAVYIGARKGALLDLRWTQVDLERGTINLNPAGRAQTTKRRPVLPIPRKLHLLLRLARRRGSDLGYVINLDGHKIGDIKRSFATACIKAGLAKTVGHRTLEDGTQEPIRKPTVSPHTLRHTCGTWMAQRGVPLWEVAGWLGHSHERTTELYAHHHPDFLSKARAALDSR